MMNIDTNAICRSILQMDSLADIATLSKQLNTAMKMRYAELQCRKAASFGIGSRVEFTGKSGATITGRILKINPKTIMVEVDNTKKLWRVTPSLLRASNSKAA
jgi:hypothetical protein